MAYPGGKNGSGVYQSIINLMPPHDTYIEPFLGAGAIMRMKRPAAQNIGVDLDPEALQHFEARTTVNGDAEGNAGSCTTINDDAFTFLQSYPFTGHELVYCDPPYLHETRAKLNLYRFELNEDQHRKLLQLLKGLPCMVMISGYCSPLYADELADWNSANYQAMTRSGKTATEYLWFNYSEPVALHDYRYLGQDYRERERIKKKKTRWVAKLQTMPLLERRALLSAMAEAWPQLAPPQTAIPADTAINDDACRHR